MKSSFATVSLLLLAVVVVAEGVSIEDSSAASGIPGIILKIRKLLFSFPFFNNLKTNSLADDIISAPIPARPLDTINAMILRSKRSSLSCNFGGPGVCSYSCRNHDGCSGGYCDNSSTCRCYGCY